MIWMTVFGMVLASYYFAIYPKLSHRENKQSTKTIYM